ncbi:RNA polymerase II 15-kda subunit, partial [Gonapodya prolifera JEL478]
LLYPKEDKDNRRLLFVCRNCQHEEPDDNRVFRHEVQITPVEQTMIIKDLGTDPTLPRADKICQKCGHNEAVYFQSRARRADTSMRLYFACANKDCQHRWVE